MDAGEPEPLIFRDELTSTMFVIRDIANDVKAIRELLEEDHDEEEG